MHILIVDDEAIERRFLKQILSREFPHSIITEARDGVEALDFAAKEKYDLALVDIKMPRMDGLELSCKLREGNPQMYIILNTAFADFTFAQKAIEAQVDAYLLKPTTGRKVIDTITALSDRSHQLCREQKTFDVLCEGKPIFLLFEPFLQAWSQTDLHDCQITSTRLIKNFKHFRNINRMKYAVVDFFICCHNLAAEGILQQENFRKDINTYISQVEQTDDINEINQILEEYFAMLINRLILLKKKENPSYVDLVEDYILKNYRSNCSLEDISNKLYHNGEYLSRLYREEKDITINQRMHQLRIQEACHRLREGLGSIEQISSYIGYNSLSHFYVNFKKIMQMTPKEYVNKTKSQRKAKFTEINHKKK